MASSPGSRTAGFIASPPAVSRPCGPPFASVVSTFPAPSGKPKPHETSALMSIPGKELHMGQEIRFGAPRRLRKPTRLLRFPPGLIQLAGEYRQIGGLLFQPVARLGDFLFTPLLVTDVHQHP